MGCARHATRAWPVSGRARASGQPLPTAGRSIECLETAPVVGNEQPADVRAGLRRFDRPALQGGHEPGHGPPDLIGIEIDDVVAQAVQQRAVADPAQRRVAVTVEDPPVVGESLDRLQDGPVPASPGQQLERVPVQEQAGRSEQQRNQGQPGA